MKNEARMVRETVLVVGNVPQADVVDIIRKFGCNVLETRTMTAVRSLRRFMEEFRQGIPVAFVHGICLNDASEIADGLKHACEHIHVIAMSPEVVQPVREVDKGYDVAIPPHRVDVRNMLEVFVGTV